MRIIAGSLKGRTLISPTSLAVRPATDRVKGSIFNMLQNRLGLGGAFVLDLFAGTGSLGFEAISRGAEKVVFVDDDDEALDLIEQNADKLGCADRCEVRKGDALNHVVMETRAYHLIFADPPYAFPELSSIPERIFSRQLLKKDGLLIIEHARRTTFPPSTAYRVAVSREFGNTTVSFFSHP